MFKLFKRKSESEKLEDEYEKLMQSAFELSKTNRAAGDEKYAAADKILKKIEALKENEA